MDKTWESRRYHISMDAKLWRVLITIMFLGECSIPYIWHHDPSVLRSHYIYRYKLRLPGSKHERRASLFGGPVHFWRWALESISKRGKLTKKLRRVISESSTKLLVMCNTHFGTIFNKDVPKFRGNDQMRRLRPGDTGMHNAIRPPNLSFFGFILFRRMKIAFMNLFPEFSPCHHHKSTIELVRLAYHEVDLTTLLSICNSCTSTLLYLVQGHHL